MNLNETSVWYLPWPLLVTWGDDIFIMFIFNLYQFMLIYTYILRHDTLLYICVYRHVLDIYPVIFKTLVTLTQRCIRVTSVRQLLKNYTVNLKPKNSTNQKMFNSHNLHMTKLNKISFQSLRMQ